MRGANGAGGFGYFCSGRNIRLQFHGLGTRPWPMGRRGVSTRGIYSLLVAGDHFSSRAILYEVQKCSAAILSPGGFSAYQVALGSNPGDSYLWQDGPSDLQLAQDTSIFMQFVQRWKLRTTVRKAAL